MTVFIKRDTAPSSTDPYWIKTTKGGYNRCIAINKDTGSVLPNCTGYAWGRFMECQGVTTCALSRANAEQWYTHTVDGYQRGQTPKLGAVICWSSTKSGGHVAIVEEIYEDDSILTSNSAYGWKRFYMKTLKPPLFRMGKAYTFQGFIYNPTEFTPTPTPTPDKKKRKRFPFVLYANKLRHKY